MIELEFATLISPIASGLIAAVGVYVAIARQLAASNESQKAVRRDIQEIKTEIADVRDELREHGERLAGLGEKSDSLAKKVEKHNSVVERTYKLESDLATAWRRHDELADRVGRLEDMKIGGTK